jgi:hypothetical protein
MFHSGYVFHSYECVEVGKQLQKLMLKEDAEAASFAAKVD